MNLSDDSLEYLMAEAYRVASQSPDPSNQNGALLIRPDGQIQSRGFNTFCKGVKVTQERLQDRDTKLFYIEHAERNAIYDHCRNVAHDNTFGLIMICPWAACADCGRAIIQAGIKEVVTHGPRMEQTPERWVASIERAIAMLDESGVRITQFDRPVRGAPDIIVNGELWNPSRFSPICV